MALSGEPLTRLLATLRLGAKAPAPHPALTRRPPPRGGRLSSACDRSDIPSPLAGEGQGGGRPKAGSEARRSRARAPRRLLATLAAFGWLLCAGAQAQDPQRVDLELVLLADASRSIDDAELMFQRSGYAAAITDPLVLSAIAGGAGRRIAITYVEWADQASQDVVVPWSVIDGTASAEHFAKALMAAPRNAFGPNAIGQALAAGHALIASNDIEGDRKVIDFSGDSAYSFGGIPIEVARSAALADDIVINGLAILCGGDCGGRPVDYDLEAAFAALIVGGPGHFVLTADRGESFAEAVRKKLLLEIAGLTPPQLARRLGEGLGARPD